MRDADTILVPRPPHESRDEIALEFSRDEALLVSRVLANQAAALEFEAERSVPWPELRRELRKEAAELRRLPGAWRPDHDVSPARPPRVGTWPGVTGNRCPVVQPDSAPCDWVRRGATATAPTTR